MYEIKNENVKLLEKLQNILKHPSETRIIMDNEESEEHLKLHGQKSFRRKKDFQRITQENSAILQKIHSARSHYDTNGWEKDFQQNQKMKEVISQRPYRTN